MKFVHDFCCKHDQNNNKYYAVINSLRAWFINFQKNDQTNDEYLKEFQTCLATLDDYDANIVSLVPCLVEDAVKKVCGATVDLATEEEIKKANEYVFKNGQQLHF